VAPTVLHRARLLDVVRREVIEDASIVFEGDRILEVSERPVALRNALTIDLGGRSVLPGLIDAHCHVTISDGNLRSLAGVPLTLSTARAGRVLRGMLDRGFTTVRDTAGAEWGLK
jgi:imidazolonepropionase-like amidohydrolase